MQGVQQFYDFSLMGMHSHSTFFGERLIQGPNQDHEVDHI